MNTEFKLIDIICYAFIIGLLIYFLIEINERNQLIYLDAQLRLRHCNVAEESIANIINNFTKGNYSVLKGIGTEIKLKTNHFNLSDGAYAWVNNLKEETQ